MPGAALRAIAVISLLAAVTSCGESTAPLTTYQLSTIDGLPLPRPWSILGTTIIHEGHFTLTSSNDYVIRYDIRCRANLPPGTTCHVSDESLVEHGHYDESEGRITYKGQSHRADISSAAVTLWFGEPGWTVNSAPTVFIFRR